MIIVDPLLHHGWKLYGRRVKSCHMFSDLGIAGDDELHAMAVKIGLKWSWFQGPGHWLRHYDLTESRRKLAVHFGAKQMAIGPELGAILKRLRLAAEVERRERCGTEVNAL